MRNRIPLRPTTMVEQGLACISIECVPGSKQAEAGSAAVGRTAHFHEQAGRCSGGGASAREWGAQHRGSVRAAARTSLSCNLPSRPALKLYWISTPDDPTLTTWRGVYSGVTLNVARPDMNNYATLGVMLY